MDSLRLSTTLPAPPERVYAAWTTSDGHAAMTGAAAEVDARAGGRHTAWDGYIEGTTLEIEDGRRILQTWRTADFPDGAADSRIEVTFEPVAEGTRLTIVHTDIPPGQGPDYRQGWQDFYFTPMAAYFRT